MKALFTRVILPLVLSAVLVYGLFYLYLYYGLHAQLEGTVRAALLVGDTCVGLGFILALCNQWKWAIHPYIVATVLIAALFTLPLLRHTHHDTAPAPTPAPVTPSPAH